MKKKQLSTTFTFGLDKKKMVRLFKIVFLFALIPIVGLAQDGLRYEVVNGDSISIFRFPSATDFDLQVSSRVDIVDDGILYHYHLINNENSNQKVTEFAIVTTYQPKNIEFPDSWYGLFGGLIEAISWFSTDTAKNIQPSEELKGLTFLSDRLPSLSKYNARGWTPTPRLPFQPDSLENSSVSEDSKQGLTLGPGLLPEEIVTDQFIDTLTTYLTQSCELGWIENPGICRSLQATLDNVKRQIEQGRTQTAVNNLQPFLNELEAIREQHLSPEAYALLRFNGEYLLAKLREE
jgi:hypothetical protein